MKISLIPVSMVAMALAGCGGTTVRESKTVIERQVPAVEQRKEIVVQTPPVTREVIVQTPSYPPQRSCTYSSASFLAGTLSCQSGKQVRCEDGTWVNRGAC